MIPKFATIILAFASSTNPLTAPHTFRRPPSDSAKVIITAQRNRYRRCLCRSYGKKLWFEGTQTGQQSFAKQIGTAVRMLYSGIFTTKGPRVQPAPWTVTDFSSPLSTIMSGTAAIGPLRKWGLLQFNQAKGSPRIKRGTNDGRSGYAVSICVLVSSACCVGVDPLRLARIYLATQAAVGSCGRGVRSLYGAGGPGRRHAPRGYLLLWWRDAGRLVFISSLTGHCLQQGRLRWFWGFFGAS